MKRNQLLKTYFSIFAISIAVFTVINHAEADTVSWVIERYQYEYETDQKGDIVERRIQTLDVDNGLTREVEIPEIWIPLQSFQGEGLYFAVPREELGRGIYDILVWNEDVVRKVDDAIAVNTDDIPWAYDGDILYTKVRPTYVESYNIGQGRMIMQTSEDQRSIRIVENGSTISVSITDFGIVELRNGYAHNVFWLNGKPVALKNVGTHAYDETQVFATCVQDGDLLTWLKLDDTEIPSFSLFSWTEGSEHGTEYRQPIHNVYHLVTCDPDTGEYRTKLSEDTKPIVLTDLEPIGGTMFYDRKRGSIFLWVKDTNPIETLYWFEWFPEGRRILLEVNLKTGEKSILHMNGNTKPDYEEVWKYRILEVGVQDEHGEGWPSLTEEQKKALSIAERTEPLYPEDVKSGVKEYWPSNMSISLK